VTGSASHVSAVRRRTALITVGLSAGTALTALALAQIFHLGLAPTSEAALLSGGVPALYVALVAFSHSLDDGELSLARVADQLATKVSTQWESEAGWLRLYDPGPLRFRG
jgi:hypothetical protein